MPDKNWVLQRKLLRAKEIGFNTEVYNHFKDVVANSSTTLPSRRALRDSLLIGAKDSRITATFKISYFREFIQRVHLKPDIYGLPVQEYHESVTFHPQVEVFFLQDTASLPPGTLGIQASISFRLMNTTATSITQSEINVLATNIKNTLIIANEGYVFSKGKFIVSYADPKNGYYLKIYAISKTEGETVIKKVLNIQNHIFDADKMTLHEPEKKSVNAPTGTVTILGEKVPKMKYRPTANVRFRYAFLKLNGLIRDKVLVDTTGHFRDAIIRV